MILKNAFPSSKCIICKRNIAVGEECEYLPYQPRGQRIRCMEHRSDSNGQTQTQTPPPEVKTVTVEKVVTVPVDPAVLQAAVDAAVAKAMAEARVNEIHVKLSGTSETRKVDGLAHRLFPDLLRALDADVQVWLAGPTGSGKTHAAEMAAKALGLPFYFNGAIDTEYKLLGFVDAQGRIVSTQFREAFTNGGAYLFDEVDGSLPSATLAFNAALSNGMADFPGTGMTKRHPNFRVIAAANTWGLGATSDYIGRAKMDAAFLNRFVRMEWDYDETLERHLTQNDAWADIVQRARKIARARGLKIVISPRDSMNGAKLIAAGFTTEQAIAMTFGAPLTPEQRRELQG